MHSFIYGAIIAYEFLYMPCKIKYNQFCKNKFLNFKNIINFSFSKNTSGQYLFRPRSLDLDLNKWSRHLK